MSTASIEEELNNGLRTVVSNLKSNVEVKLPTIALPTVSKSTTSQIPVIRPGTLPMQAIPVLTNNDYKFSVPRNWVKIAALVIFALIILMLARGRQRRNSENNASYLSTHGNYEREEPPMNRQKRPTILRRKPILQGDNDTLNTQARDERTVPIAVLPENREVDHDCDDDFDDDFTHLNQLAA